MSTSEDDSPAINVISQCLPVRMTPAINVISQCLTKDDSPAINVISQCLPVRMTPAINVIKFCLIMMAYNSLLYLQGGGAMYYVLE